MMIFRLLSAASILAAATAAETAATASPFTGSATVSARATDLNARDVFALRLAEDVQISPDGRTVAYVLAETDPLIDGRRRSIRLVDVETRTETLLASAATSPRWSPDGKRIAFVTSTADGGSEIRVSSRAGGLPGSVIHLPGTPFSLAWSPDGQSIAFLRFIEDQPTRFIPAVEAPPGARWAAAPRITTQPTYQTDGERVGVPGHVRLFVSKLDGSAPRQLTAADTKVNGEPVWTRDGRSILFTGSTGEAVGNTHLSDRIYRVPLTGGPASPVTPANLGAHDPALSPDGRQLAFAASRPNDRNYQQSGLFTMPFPTGPAREILPKLDREVQLPTFSADGRSIFLTYGDRGRLVLARLETGDRPEIVALDLADDEGYSVAANGTAAFAAASTTRPAEVAVVQRAGLTERLTALNEALLGGKSLAASQRITFRSKTDGVEVGGWLLLPRGSATAGPSPTILSIHGGPHGSDVIGFSVEDQLFAAAGYAVLRIDYRGSLSYGYAFADRIARDWPGPAYEDLMSGVDAAIERGFADPAKLFIEGGSAGGELTAWAIGSTKRFNAAVAAKPVINAASQQLTTYQYNSGRDQLGAYPWEDPLLFWRSSPLSLVANVSTPTLLIVGEQDHNTPPTEAEQFYDALQLLHIPSALVIVPDAGHATLEATPSRLVAEVGITLDWFGRHGGIAVPPAWIDPGANVRAQSAAAR